MKNILYIKLIEKFENSSFKIMTSRGIQYAQNIHHHLNILMLFLGLWIIVFGSAESNIRGRKLHNLINIDPIPCNPGTNGTNCICPDTIKSDFTGCLEYSEKIHGCHPINCWKWNEIKGNCEEAGKDFVPAIILQSIPVTGMFGSGFGNMGRWDIFGTYWLVIGCGCLCSCCMGAGAGCASQADDKHEAMAVGGKCGSCLTSIAIMIMWIWGIVVIANKEVDAPWTDWEGNKIMCPLVI
jgi:hypothetical protein